MVWVGVAGWGGACGSDVMGEEVGLRIWRLECRHCLAVSGQSSYGAIGCLGADT